MVLEEDQQQLGFGTSTVYIHEVTDASNIVLCFCGSAHASHLQANKRAESSGHSEAATCFCCKGYDTNLLCLIFHEIHALRLLEVDRFELLNELLPQNGPRLML